jgi:hypothetical protein
MLHDMSALTANQHYVWQHYLRAWGTPKKIWCMRLGDAEPFHTSPRNVGSERYFYQFQELTSEDLTYLEQVISKSSDLQLQDINRGWITHFQRSFAIRKGLADRAIEPTLRQQLETELRAIEMTLGERYHGATEARAIPLLNALREGDASFYDDVDACANFIQFLTLQYFRTAKMRNAMVAIDHPLPHEMARTWPIEAFIYATNVGASLFRQRRECRIVFLRNRATIPLITGDQPVINLTGAEDEELNFYYPLTPGLAMIYTSDRRIYTTDQIEIGALAAERYNFRIYAKSDSQIYGNDPAYLKALHSLPKEDQIS